ncbi:AAA ATPase midasin [Friedmanniomyces endolithicus]|uniref:Midasin n=1 Tax=Friedmanniomyces endolithicus TaxID=329885 RepID=A0AAN6J865_9PEZI|nr:AAA ATPase midasin [Friedmanniomyces endolithicus]
MESSWDAVHLQHHDQLPPELLHILRHGTNEQYLEAITDASLDARYTYLIFAHYENIFSHVCATVRTHGSLASSIATIARILPCAPYLAPFATQTLSEPYTFNTPEPSEEDLLYLLGLFRLLHYDYKGFRSFVDVAQVQSLLRATSRPVVYLAIRVLQFCLDGADHWFEQMIKEYLGEDTPDLDISGQWDDRVIDYRFLTLWEEERFQKVEKLVHSARADAIESVDGGRAIPAACFHPNTVLVAGIVLPYEKRGKPAGTDRLVYTTTVRDNLAHIAKALKTPRPLLLAGLAGSGKTLLARHVAACLGKLEKMVTLHLNEQSDAKLLIGIYTTGDTPGSFLWKPGVLTTAVEEGRWVLIEDLDRAPNEIIGMLLPLIERRELLIPGRKQTVHAAQGFQIIATVRNHVNHRGDETRPLAHMLGARHWQNVTVRMQPLAEQKAVAEQLFPSLSQLIPQFMAVYQRLQASNQRVALVGTSKTGIARAISPRDLLKWCNRVMKLLHQRSTFTSSDVDDMFIEAIDCFVGALPDGSARVGMAAIIAEELRIDPQRRDYLLTERDVRYDVDKSRISVGRYSLPRVQAQRTSAAQSTFSTNPHTTRMLERVAAAVVNREPLLLVGETGVGKTTAVQHLASQLGKKLEPFNLSQQSEAGDLLGGFKPVTARSLIIPMKDEFDELFLASFSTSKNQQFLDLLGKQMVRSNWPAVCKLWQQALKMVDLARSAKTGETPSKKRKLESKKIIDFTRWDTFAIKVTEMDHRLSSGSEAFAFSFVEGNIVRAVRNGDWVLLDEINLASPDTLESIIDLLEPSSPSLLLTEAGNIERIEAHPEFRVFAAMNPATDVGKKDLPPGIRSRFTELYVESPDKDIKSLQSIVRSYLRVEAAADPAIAVDVSLVYQKTLALAEQNKLVDGAGQMPHFSLRTLTRTLSYAKHIAPQCSLRRALYEGFQMSFLTFLNAESARSVQPLLEQHLLGKRTNVRSELQKALRKPDDGKSYIQGYPGSKHWVHEGSIEVLEQPEYILTPFIKTNLENLVRATSTRQFPVLIQGPTSSGKTSMIEYLAKRTGHIFVRINNHEHTDLQEYLGTYVSGTDGRLQFQEGVLVQALREGHWIVLDELNLAPTDVLEALNRLLDDNRELLIPETQETVRPHGDFMLFATQNPAGLYGGRKTLSRAFRNRFLELHFDDIPIEELQEILHRRTHLPESRCKRIVTVYRELALLRQESRLFEQKSFATLRDLFRWAFRPNDTIEQLAANGYMLLAERVRKPEERGALKAIIEKALSANGPRVVIDENAIYAQDCPEVLAYQTSAGPSGVVWTKAMRRLYVLVSRALQNNEPVVLVGETGCGKTTVCQMLAEAVAKQLYTVNAHQNTETGDLIGSQRPVRNRSAVEVTLRDHLYTSQPLQNLDTAAAHSTDVLLSAYDQAVSALDRAGRLAYCASQAHLDLQALRTSFKALFEWVDGGLVQAMREGAFFLLDEISLADDSVLERINSVLEPQRSILLAEKGSLDSFVTASVSFQFFATMNPGGDYGKRELSPALRNRFTEIWVPSLSDTEDIVQIVSAKLVANARSYAIAMVAFSQWFKDRYNTSASSSVSIRDSLAWVQFVNACAEMDVMAAIVHGAAMVYIDTLGANPAGLMSITGANLEVERTVCLAQLSYLLGSDAGAIYSAPSDVTKADESLKFGPFAVQSRVSGLAPPTAFTFDAPTTRRNAMRVVRAMQLSRPVLLEGSPGVGKTALVTAIATAASVPLTRINLSEQTDLLDLFGSDAPVEGAATGVFAWRDAPFLQAMKRGDWVLLDEMNLASQSVLEGLNACLDHRGEVFVPELGQTFHKHPEFRLFAAQNPHHQGGGRKGLPASFVNRFTVVYADAFHSEDLMLICKRSFPQLPVAVLEQAVRFVSLLDLEVSQRRHFGANGGPWEFNLRDISRWLALLSADQGLLRAGNARDFARMLFTQRFRSALDRIAVCDLLDTVFRDSFPPSDLFESISPSDVQLGLARLPRNLSQATPTSASQVVSQSSDDGRNIEAAMICIEQRWPVILIGPSGCGKTRLIETLATVVGASLTIIALNADTDAMDLIGGYEQSDPLRQNLQALDRCRSHLSDLAKASALAGPSSETTSLLADIRERPLDVLADLDRLRAIATTHSDPTVVKALADIIIMTEGAQSAIDKARFEWTDGLLVEALEQGKWLVLDNANLCSSSVLDRLNSLLEPDGLLIINEHSAADGSPRIVRPHPSFRIFLTVDPRYGELSRAMRNRAVELCLARPDRSHVQWQPLQPESAVARFRHWKVVDGMSDRDFDHNVGHLAQDHASITDQQLAHRFSTQLESRLYGRARWVGTIAAVPSQDSLRLLTSFYDSATVQAQASADFARVQTLHPLNNQVLIQQSEHLYTQASTLALVHEFHIRLDSLFDQIKSCRSKQSVMRQLERSERALYSKRAPSKAGNGLLATLEAIMRLTFDWLHNVEDVPLQQLSQVSTTILPLCTFGINQKLQVRSTLHHLCGYWTFALQIISGGIYDSTLLTAWLAAFRSITQDVSQSALTSVRARIPEVLLLLDGIGGSTATFQGSACATLWAVLKPPMPPSIAQLEPVLGFEQVTHRFDQACRRFDVPIPTLIQTRMTFARALKAAKSGNADLSEISQRLGLLVPEITDDIAVTLPERRPHLARVFQALSQHAALLTLVDRSLPDEQTTTIELLALRPTSDSILTTEGPPAHLNVRAQFNLLSRVFPAIDNSSNQRPSHPLPSTIVEHIVNATQVSLGDLDLLEYEGQALGQTIARQPHILNLDEVKSLDSCLMSITKGVLVTLASSRSESGTKNMALQLLADLEAQNDRSPQTSCITSHDPSRGDSISGDNGLERILAAFNKVIVYLRTTIAGQKSSSSSAAEAWTAYGMACLALYLPREPFDPALRPRVERDIHRRTLLDLQTQLQMVKTFRAALFGEKESLRSRTVQADISHMGPEPAVEEICRPEVSAMSELQADIDGLTRALTPLWQGSTASSTSSVLFWNNLDRIRNRLEHQYRAYGDLTAPAIGFIDCIRVGRMLSIQADVRALQDDTSIGLAQITPFVGASYADWSEDGAFLRLFSGRPGQGDTLLAMSVLAARLQYSGLPSLSPALLIVVDQQFERFYDSWKTRLSDEQRRSAADSSLYRYKGDDDLSDEAAAEELAALFPSHHDVDAASGLRTAAIEIESFTEEIAEVHRAIFRGQSSSPGTLLGLLERYTQSTGTGIYGTGAEKNVASILWSAHNLTSRLSGVVQVGVSYNMYTDPNIREAKRVRTLINIIRRRFDELHLAWPEHATPIEVQRVCDQVLGVGHAEPLLKFLPVLEKLHATMTQWQQIASREFSVVSELEEVTSLIVSWRQTELSSWAGLLDREDHACRKAAASWWYVAYESIIAAVRALQHSPLALRGHTEGLLQTLASFLSTCGLAEFLPRMDMLRDFEAHLRARKQDGSTFVDVQQALANFVAFHERFEDVVAQKLAKGRTDLEKEIKNVIQVASWKDRNVQSLKQSAASSHKRLVRMVRKYRALLAGSVGPLLVGGIPPSGPFTESVSSIVVVAATTPVVTRFTTAAFQIAAWDDRPARFRHIEGTVSLMRTKAADVGNSRASDEVARYNEEVREAIQSLQRETPAVLIEKTKDQIQDLKRRKRRLLADVIREVQNMGFQRSMGDDVLSQQAALHNVLSKSPAMIVHPKDSILAGTEHYFHSFLAILPSVRQSARKHSDDLTPAEAVRCMTLLESMLQTAVVQRSALCNQLRRISRLQSVLCQVHSLASTESLVIEEHHCASMALGSHARCLGSIIQTCTQLLQAQAALAGDDKSAIVGELSTIALQLGTFEEDMRSEPPLPAGIGIDRDPSSTARFSELTVGLEKAISVCVESHPSTGPILDHVRRWTGPTEPSPLQSNGHVSQTLNAWVNELQQTLDTMLGAVENVEERSKAYTVKVEQPRWLVRTGVALNNEIDALRLDTITQSMSSLLAGLAHVALESANSLTAIAAVCQSIWPVVDAFAATCQKLLESAIGLHFETNKLAYHMAMAFMELAQRGFCTPSEKAGNKDQQAGEVESGTGLGDGEGGEDISKDVGDDEDLGELAEEPQASGASKDLPDEKDAVDMADQEMEGGFGEEPEGSEQGEGNGDDSPGADGDVDEEAGAVDEQGPSAMDEKMWDEGANDERPDKEGDDVQGSSTNDESAAAREGKQKEKDEPGQEDAAGTDDVPDEEERIETQDMEHLDPHTDEQDNLDLPADITVDGKEVEEDVDSDMDRLSDDDVDELNDTADDTARGESPDREAPEAEETGELDQTGSPSDTLEAGDDASEEGGDDEGTHSDVLMEDDLDAHDAEANNDEVSGEAGQGNDNANTETQNTAQAAAQSLPPDQNTEPGAEEQDGEDATASGDVEGKRTQDTSSLLQKAPKSSQPSLPYKKIGDVLDEWYQQHREIESAKQPQGDEGTSRPEDTDMASARFEHLPDQDTAADTQALGTASVDQSTALNEDSGLPNNGEEDATLPPLEEDIHDQQQGHDVHESGRQIESIDVSRLDPASNAFVGEPQNANIDADMSEHLPADEEDQVQDVDQQLTDTHLDGADPDEGLSLQEARHLWSEHEASTRNLALVLTEHLRLVLHPTQATKMRGDFRTGKRLNIKRIIPYIASSYKRDKIWMRRSVPSKRSYQIMLAIDDSKSMAESESKHLAFETVALVAKAMSMLEVGELSVVGFGENVNVAHDFSTPFTSDAGAQIFKQFSFAQSRTNVRQLLAESIEIFRSARLKASGSASELWQLQLIISDGVCEDHPSIRQLVRQAQEERIMVVFIVVDAAAQKVEAAGGPKQSILDLQTAEFVKDEVGEMQLKMVKYLDTFPFNYYLIVREVQELPAVLAGALRQWLAEVVETGG